MIAKDNKILTSAAQSLYTINSDELIREQCQAREDFERHERTVQKQLADNAKLIAEQTETIENLTLNNQKLHNEISELRANLQKSQNKNAELETDLQNLYHVVQSLQNQLNPVS